MSIFEFADQLGFNPPIVFEDDTVSEEGLYNDVIDFDKLAKTIGKYRSFEFDYREYISNKTTTPSINAIDGTEPESYKIHIPLVINDPEKGERTLQLSGVLNKKIGKVNRNEGSSLFSFKLDANKRIISYIKKIKYETSNEIAIRIETPVYEDYLSLSEIVKTSSNKEVDALIIRKFNEAFRNVKDDATLKWLYEKAPLFVLQQRGNETLIKDLKTLLAYDLEGALSWFKDSGTAVMKLLFGFTDPKVLYDYFNTKPEEAIRIYDALQGDAEVQFTTLLTMLAQLYTREVKNDNIIQGASRRAVTFNIGKGYRLNSDILIKDDQKNIKLERFGPREFEFDIQLNNTDGEAVDIPLKVPINALLEGPTIFHPLDLVILKDANGNGEVPVCALEVKYLSDEAEWETVINTTLIIVNIVGILVSAGALSAGATGLTAIIATADIVISTIDIAVILRRPELRGTQEGAWLDRNWEAISGTFAIVSVSSAVRQGLIKNGPGIVGKLNKVKDASSILIRERIQRLLFQAIINVEISNFGKTTFRVMPIMRSALRLKILQSNIERLWKLGITVLESQIEGKAFYGLMYQGEVLFTGNSKKINNFLKNEIFVYGIKNEDIIKVFDELLEIEKLGLRLEAGNWFWKNGFGRELRWAKLKPQIISKNIDIKLEAIRKGDVFEGEVGKRMLELSKIHGDELVDFSNQVWGKNVRGKFKDDFGDIDFATKKYIGEVKSKLSNSKIIEQVHAQLQKYLHKNSLIEEKFLNPQLKQVVLVYEDLGNFTLSDPLLKELAEDGVIFIEGINNLKKLY
ncbi:hypothetical protein GCM10011344_24890 [Dokdonia pacifica]|uniref:Uncharacterized protein n=1 Tax=Dokdonia pacifica TaxID=1627892 RepID=A0A238WQR7_9FLAO|nr:hypothetical protein [Dokdonia pacifica]GGG23174.1 hypothetical protein GCM10011344_24890 [Dokdonia pacifica]SNR48673.1 hypothetical protein SAMN06265376_1011319 [Dokdonia pacifica]